MEKPMKRILISLSAALLVLGLASGHAVWGDSYDQPGVYDMQPDDTLFTSEELHDLLAPIALYPDPLIAQILPAATFIDQVDEAVRYVRQYGNAARIDDQPWDVSVKAVAHYPDVLFMMDQKYDWTVSLGQAFVNQQQDVMDAIQQLRAEAQTARTLVSTPQQQVIVEGGIISIVPAVPDMIYIPQYDPLVVYVENPYPSYGFVTFGVGFTIGVWLNRDCDWHRHRVYYHGWKGAGWIGRARPHVHDRGHIYINNRFAVINVNQRVIQHDTHRFREDIRQNVQQRRERGGHPASGISAPPRGRTENHGAAPRPALQTPRPAAQTPRPITSPARPPQRPDARDVYRGRETHGIQPVPAATGYGGYGTGRDAQTYRERGQTSRENMRQPDSRPSPASRGQTAAPVQLQKHLGGKPLAAPARQPAPRQAVPSDRDGKGQRPQH
jgi:hypothetical protein